MIALKLIFQSLAGVAAAGACIGGSVYGITKTFSDSSNIIVPSSYYLVTVTKPTINEAQQDLWVSNLQYIESSNDDESHGERHSSLTDEQKTEFEKKEMEKLNQKNYTCKFSANERDDTCNLFNIDSNDDNETIDIEKIKEFIKAKGISSDEIYKTTSNSLFQSPKFFLLRVANSKKHLMNSDTSSTITLLSTVSDQNEKGKIYGTLSVHGEITEEKAEGKVNLFIGKVADGATQQSIVAASEGINHKCYFKKQEESKKSCTIFSLSSPNTATDVKEINFSSINVKSAQTEVNLEAGKFFLIAFSEDINYWSSDSEESIVFVETTTSAGTNTPKKTELKIKAPIFAATSASGVMTQAAIIK